MLIVRREMDPLVKSFTGTQKYMRSGQSVAKACASCIHHM